VPTVTIHYGNWVMLPEQVLKVLGLTTGDRLEVKHAGVTSSCGPPDEQGSQVRSCRARSSRSTRGKTLALFPKSQHPKHPGRRQLEREDGGERNRGAGEAMRLGPTVPL
jgi:hypothetical protein